MLSQTTDYALRAIVCVADAEAPMTAQRIAETTLVPVSYLSKVMRSLVKAKLVESRRGVNGGFQIARPPEEIAVLDVVNAVDPIQRIVQCPLGLPLHGQRLCPLHRKMDEGVALIEAAFARHTIADLLRERSKATFPDGLCAPRKRQGAGEAASAPPAP